MYAYDEFDHAFVRDRTEQFRDQVARRLSGDLTEDQFKPLRLMNGVYLQLHAYMLRIAIPYGVLNPTQMRKLADIADQYDRGYGHFTTRQNLQFNWPKLVDIPAILDELASVEMHAIQTSGACIRNVTADQYAGAAADEIDDPRPWAELLRQWSTLHPEFSFLPRKFKIAITGAPSDRAAVRVHDIGLRMHRDADGEPGFQILVGGGLGRSPFIGKVLKDHVKPQELLRWLEAALRVYNFYGRRENKYKARIKILVHELGIEGYRAKVDEEFARMDDRVDRWAMDELARIKAHFAPPVFADLPAHSQDLAASKLKDPAFARWAKTNRATHRADGYSIVNISLKPVGAPPGDISADQMRIVADLAERFGLGDIRVTHEQNLVLPHVRDDDLHALWRELDAADLATPNAGLVSDIIACPGLDYCALANAKSIPIAQRISERFADFGRQEEIGALKIKISGCINACGHHHVGHIGVLGVDRKNEEHYQILIGGDAGEEAAIGEILGPGFSAEGVVDAVETIVETWLALREEDELLPATTRRLGLAPFKDAVYANS